MTTPAVIPKPHTATDDAIGVKFSVDTVAVDADATDIVVDAAVAAVGVDADEFDLVMDPDYDDCALQHPLSVNIRPILKSVAGVLTDHEIDQWFVELEQANEKHGIRLEMLGKGELVISPMVNLDSNFAEVEFGIDLGVWSRSYGGRTSGSNGIIRLPDGTRVHPDAAWLSPEQVAELGSIRPSRAIDICPVFVAEIMSYTDRLPPMQRKMERYIANGAKLGWLIDPYHRRVYIYRPGVPVAVLDDPETISGDPILPGFVFAVRQRIFALHD